MVEEPLKMKKKYQINFDEQEAIRLQAEFDEEVRLAREKDKANIALIEEWNDIQAKIDADYQLAQRLQAQEQEELTIEEKAKLFQQLLEKRKNTLLQKEQKKIGTDHQQNINKGVSCSEVRAEGSETREESSSKRAGDELEQEKAKKQKIVEFKILKEGKISYYQIIRANGSSKRYSTFIPMLRSFDREDLETLWKLVKAKHGYIRPEEGYERVLWGDLKIMFEHHSTLCEVSKSACIYVGREEISAYICYKLIIGMKCVISFLSSSQSNSRINEVFGSILLGRIVRIKRLLDDLRVTAAKLMLLVQKLLLLVLKVNAAGIKVTTAERLRKLEEFMLTEKRSKTY
ncbi:hypothetical protein Tco_1163476 [Tanacetum coccineum]